MEISETGPRFYKILENRNYVQWDYLGPSPVKEFLLIRHNHLLVVFALEALKHLLVRWSFQNGNAIEIRQRETDACQLLDSSLIYMRLRAEA